jgi:sigma-B regulation protein RsbU (phosphoserine phosphatase)
VKTFSENNSDLTGVRVLVVEDSPVERARLYVVLKSMGIEPLLAENADQALREAENAKIDIVLCDWLMPGMSGLALCEHLVADEGLGHPYFIMLTGRESSVDFIAAMDAGADDYIVKPAWREELRVRLQSGIRSLRRNQKLPSIPVTPRLARVYAI